MDGPDADDRNRDRPSRRDPPSEPETGPPSKTGDRERTAGSRSRAKCDDAVTIEDDGVVRWLLETEDRTGTAVRDIATIGAIIAVVGVFLFGITGAWPPMVAVESGSMEPALERGDLVFIADDGRFAGDGAVAGTGIVTDQSALERPDTSDWVSQATLSSSFRTVIRRRRRRSIAPSFGSNEANDGSRRKPIPHT